jgi:hypothetical protein
MGDFDRVFVAPSAAELNEALRVAAATANAERRALGLRWPPPRLPRTLARVQAEAEGVQVWGDGVEGDLPRERTEVALAWWRDFIGRPHVRILGRRGQAAWSHGQPRRALAAVYGEQALVRVRGREAEAVLVLCPCGAWGEPDTLGWMGDRCGPCHDRRSAGQEPPRAWPAFAEGGAASVACAGWALAVLRGAGWGPSPLDVWDVQTGRQTASCKVDLGEGASVAVSPDGRFLGRVGVGGDNDLIVWDTATGRQVKWLPIDGPPFVFAPDGGAVWGLYRGSAAVCPLPGGEVWRRQPDRDDGAQALALSPDGRRVALGRRIDVLVRAADGRELARQTLPHPRRTRPAFAADGRLFVVVRSHLARDPVTLFEVGAGRSVAELAWPWPASVWEMELNVAPDGGTAAVAWGRLLRAWPLDGSAFLEGHDVARCAFLPDGRLLTFGGRDGAVNLWPAEALRC